MLTPLSADPRAGPEVTTGIGSILIGPLWQAWREIGRDGGRERREGWWVKGCKQMKRTELQGQMGRWRAQDAKCVASEAAVWSVDAAVNEVMILDLQYVQGTTITFNFCRGSVFSLVNPSASAHTLQNVKK